MGDDHASETVGNGGPRRRNPALTALTLIGTLALAIGTIGTFAARSSAERQATVDSYTRALIADSGGYAGDWRDVVPNYTVSWVFAGLAVLGILMLISALTVKAARP